MLTPTQEWEHEKDTMLMPFLFRLITSEVISDVRLRKPGCIVKTFQYNSFYKSHANAMKLSPQSVHCRDSSWRNAPSVCVLWSELHACEFACWCDLKLSHVTAKRHTKTFFWIYVRWVISGPRWFIGSRHRFWTKFLEDLKKVTEGRSLRVHHQCSIQQELKYRKNERQGRIKRQSK